MANPVEVIDMIPDVLPTQMPDDTALVVDGITLRFGGLTALDDVSFIVARGQICGLIGPNGAGKTSLFNCISRLYTPQYGHVQFDDVDLLRLGRHEIAGHGVGRTFQNVGLFPSMDVLANVLVGAQPRLRAGYLSSALRLPRVVREERRLRDEARALLEQLGLSHHMHSKITELPYGTLKKIELARALMARPALLLLDEPAAGLVSSEVHELARFIADLRTTFGLTVVLVEHHMGLVTELSDHVVVLDGGRKLAEGHPAAVARMPEVIEAYLGEAPGEPTSTSVEVGS